MLGGELHKKFRGVIGIIIEVGDFMSGVIIIYSSESNLKNGEIYDVSNKNLIILQRTQKPQYL